MRAKHVNKSALGVKAHCSGAFPSIHVIAGHVPFGHIQQAPDNHALHARAAEVKGVEQIKDTTVADQRLLIAATTRDGRPEIGLVLGKCMYLVS